MKKIKENKGITLVALIITIIVLLILAVVAISAVQGDGIIAHAKNARDDYQTAQSEENTVLGDYLTKIEEANSIKIANNNEFFEKYYGILLNDEQESLMILFSFHNDNTYGWYNINDIVTDQDNNITDCSQPYLETYEYEMIEKTDSRISNIWDSVNLDIENIANSAIIIETSKESMSIMLFSKDYSRAYSINVNLTSQSKSSLEMTLSQITSTYLLEKLRNPIISNEK